MDFSLQFSSKISSLCLKKKKEETVQISNIITTPPLPEYKIISLGYRCSVAGILKKMGLKYENFPFDWLVSRLSVIKHCIEDDFQEFFRLENYQEKCTLTISNTNEVCNMFYQPTHPINAYQFHLAMTHHNIIHNPKDYEYYKHCVDRFRKEFKNVPQQNGDGSNLNASKMFMYISPLFTIEEYQQYGEIALRECYDFQRFLERKMNEGNSSSLLEEPVIRSLYFIMLLDNLENYPTLTVLHEETNNKKYKYKIYLLKTNHQFVDEGETFMGNYKEEQELIENSIRRFSI